MIDKPQSTLKAPCKPMDGSYSLRCVQALGFGNPPLVLSSGSISGGFAVLVGMKSKAAAKDGDFSSFLRFNQPGDPQTNDLATCLRSLFIKTILPTEHPQGNAAHRQLGGLSRTGTLVRNRIPDAGAPSAGAEIPHPQL